MQFGPDSGATATWRFDYPNTSSNRFERRVANARFIAEKVKEVEHHFTHMIFVHVSMFFGIPEIPLQEGITTWLFPMFLTPSYEASGEKVSAAYTVLEQKALVLATHILTPSHLEKRQLITSYTVPPNHIHVVPRGVDTRLLNPQIRTFEGAPLFCSVGSIKPQKNTLELVRLFAQIKKKHPKALLKIIGPIQDRSYGEYLQQEIRELGLTSAIELTGHIPPDKLAETIAGAHIHLSTSSCETFGRAIFETLASGVPNIAKKSHNAAAEFLHDLPYAHFSDDHESMLTAVNTMLANLSTLSTMAMEIGTLYDDAILSEMLLAKICQRETIGISDFDGTLFHKEDPERTIQSIDVFRRFSKRILCSARTVSDLLNEMRHYDLDVDWIVGCSGAVVADGQGKQLWSTPLQPHHITHLEQTLTEAKRIEHEGDVLQLSSTAHPLPEHPDLRVEIYQGIAFIGHWEASKLRAIHRLLRTINWTGQVATFGDGRYDREMLVYYDGTLITKGGTQDA